MSDPAASRRRDDSTLHEQEPSPEEIIIRFRLTFQIMSEQLEFAQVIDENGEMKLLEENDIAGFLRDIMQFSRYLRTWEEQKIKISGSIISIDGVREYLQQVGIQLNTALQFDKGKQAYFEHLTRSSNFLSEMLKMCFITQN